MIIYKKKIKNFIRKTQRNGTTIPDYLTQGHMNNPIDKCVICDKDTEYKFNDHIDFRYGYVEGAGQCCKECYEKV